MYPARLQPRKKVEKEETQLHRHPEKGTQWPRGDLVLSEPITKPQGPDQPTVLIHWLTDLHSHTQGVSDECGPTCSGLPAQGHGQTPSEAARRVPSGQEGPSRAAASTGLSPQDTAHDCARVKHDLSDSPEMNTQRAHKAVLTAHGQGSGAE